MNAAKCVVLRFCFNNSDILYTGTSPYHINGSPNDFVSSHTDLRITVDRKEYFLPKFRNRYIFIPIFEIFTSRYKCQSSLVYQSIKFWNNFPPEISSSVSIELFTNSYKCQPSLVYQSIKFWNKFLPEIISSDIIELFTIRYKFQSSLVHQSIKFLKKTSLQKFHHQIELNYSLTYTNVSLHSYINLENFGIVIVAYTYPK